MLEPLFFEHLSPSEFVSFDRPPSYVEQFLLLRHFFEFSGIHVIFCTDQFSFLPVKHIPIHKWLEFLVCRFILLALNPDLLQWRGWIHAFKCRTLLTFLSWCSVARECLCHSYIDASPHAVVSGDVESCLSTGLYYSSVSSITNWLLPSIERPTDALNNFIISIIIYEIINRSLSMVLDNE
jgi:hypothetical protein